MQRLIGGLILLGLLAGCKTSPATPPSTQESERTIITFACRDHEQVFYADLVEQFESINPDIHVQLVSIDSLSSASSEDDSRRLMTAADTLATWVDQEMTQQGLVRDLSSLIQADPAFDSQDFYPNSLEVLQWDGGSWGLPLSIDEFHLIYYDKELFDAAGVSYPQPGWTWDDFLSKAQALTEWDGEQVLRWGYVDLWWDPTPFVQGRSGPLDRSQEALVSFLEQPAVAEAVRWYADLALEHQIMPVPERGERMEHLESQAAQWVAGRQAAMWSETTWFWDHWSAGRELGIVPFPVDGPASATTPLEVYSLVMSAGTTHPQASWRWLNFLSQQPPRSGNLPARRSVAASSGYWDDLDQEQAVVYRYALEHSFPRNRRLLWSRETLYDALESVFEAEKDVEEVLAEAQGQRQVGVGAAGVDEKETPVVVVTPQPERPSESAGQKIVFAAPDEIIYSIKNLVEEFHRAHPDIVVEALSTYAVTQDYDISIVAEDVDCFVRLWQEWSDEDLANFLLLDPLLEADVTFPIDDFYPLAMEKLRVEGQLWALPVDIQPRMMFYNKKAFDAVGLAYPSPEWTLDDFLMLAVALTEGEGTSKRYGYLPHRYAQEELFFTQQYGARLIDDSTQTPAFLFDAPTTVQAVQWYTGLSLAHGVIPGPQPERPELDWKAASEERDSAIRGGRAAMWSDYPVTVAFVLFDEEIVQVGVAPMPWGPGRLFDFMLQAFYISPQTEHPQVCWEWFKFLTEQPSLFADRKMGWPARQSVAKSVDYRQQVGASVAAAFQLTIEQSDPHAGLPYGWGDRPEIAFPIYQFCLAVQAVMMGEDAEFALGEAQRKAEAFVLCLEARQDLAGQERIETCIQEADPLAPTGPG